MAWYLMLRERLKRFKTKVAALEFLQSHTPSEFTHLDLVFSVQEVVGPCNYRLDDRQLYEVLLQHYEFEAAEEKLANS